MKKYKKRYTREEVAAIILAIAHQLSDDDMANIQPDPNKYLEKYWNWIGMVYTGPAIIKQTDRLGVK